MAKFKKPKSPPLSPGRKMFLLVWTGVIVCFSFLIFARTGPRMMFVGILLSSVMGMLVGLKLLRKFDELLRKLGMGPSTDASGAPKPQLNDVLGLLRTHRKKGKFSKLEFERWCHDQSFKPETLHRVMTEKGWVLERSGEYMITSKGEDLLNEAL